MWLSTGKSHLCHRPGINKSRGGIALFFSIERHLDVIQQKRGEPSKAKQSKLNYTVNFRMKNRSSGDPHGGVALPEVDCKPLKMMRGNISWGRPHPLPELTANRFDSIDGIHTPAANALIWTLASPRTNCATKSSVYCQIVIWTSSCSLACCYCSLCYTC